MKLATKYQATYLRSIILPRLLDQWYATSPEDFSGESDILELRTTSTRRYLEDAILIVNDARVCNAPILLPCALLVCSEVFESIGRNVLRRWEKLSMADHITISSAILKLSQALRRYAQQPAFFPSRDDITSCLGGVDCRTNFSTIGSIFDRVGLIQLLYDSTLQWELVGEIGPHICAACMERRKECYATHSREIWKELPSYFDLPPWEELRKQSGLDDAEE